jgi:hypothetical protein
VDIRKIINEAIDEERDGVRVTGGVNAVVAATVNESGASAGRSRSVSRVSSRQRIVQRNGETVVHEHHVETDDGSDEQR